MKTSPIPCWAGLLAYLVAREDVTVTVNPVQRGLATRWSTARRCGAPLIRVTEDAGQAAPHTSRTV